MCCSYGDLAAAAGSTFLRGGGSGERDAEGEDETSNTEAFNMRSAAAAPQVGAPHQGMLLLRSTPVRVMYDTTGIRSEWSALDSCLS